MTTTRPNNITTALSIFVTLAIASITTTTAQATAPTTGAKITIYEEAGSCTTAEIRELRKRFPEAEEIICIEDNDVLEMVTPLPRRDAEITETRQPRFGATTTAEMSTPLLVTETCGVIDLSGSREAIGAQLALGMDTKCLLEANLPGVGMPKQVATK